MTKEKDETKPKKKRKLKWQVKLFLLILFIIIYAFFIGPKGIFIKDYNIKTSKISNLSSGIKILQISDIYYGSTINKSNIKKIVKKINENNVDVVIFTGDLISKNYDITDEDKTFLKKWLNKIDTELGKYYTTGEEDFEDTNEILGMAGFTNLNNNPQSIYDESNTPIIIMDKSVNKEYLESGEAAPYFKILAIHNPDDIDDFNDANIDMAIAGHTLNGEINIPKLRELFISSKYKKGYQKVGNTKLYINAGCGTKGIKVRLFNHPTLNLYRINKTSTK